MGSAVIKVSTRAENADRSDGRIGCQPFDKLRTARIAAYGIGEADERMRMSGQRIAFGETDERKRMSGW